MSVLTRKRLLVTLLASLAVSTSLLAANPSPRTQVRMAYDPAAGNTVLFGGLSPLDSATRSYFEIGETWVFGGSRWIQQFPANSPSARAAHMMVTDTKRGRVLLFGGRRGTEDLNDLWTWRNGNWVEIPTATAPTARELAGIAYDRARDRVILFGGARYSDDKKSMVDLYDTWEFDGTNWQQRATTGPSVGRPLLVYDAARNQTLMLGINADAATVMYQYNPADASWTELKPTPMPLCVNEGGLVYQEQSQKVLLVGGVCAATIDAAFEWDGTAWTALDTETAIDPMHSQAIANDPVRGITIVFGGTDAYGTKLSTTYVLAGGDWTTPADSSRPAPRSLAAFVSDPVTKSIWMYGGLNQTENGYLDDFWQYRNGQWYRLTTDPAPTSCGHPAAAYDSDRSKIVLNCAGDTIWEFDVNAQTWATFTGLKTRPSNRRFAHLAYDPQLKKTVLFGGLDAFYEYKNDTWLWDGAAWTQIKKDKADARALGAMWFDSSLKKVVLYGGIGRPRPEDSVVRYNDMWSFDTNKGWTKMAVTTTPGERFGALVTIDPTSGKTLLYGGLRVDQVTETTRKQVYADDLWEWNGTAWTKLSPTNVPPARENGMFAYDPTAGKFVVFAGFAGFYRSDLWTSSDLMTWKPDTDSFERRRVVRR